MKLRDWLIYITNNEETPRHEEIFDIGFFIVNTVALVVGIYMFIAYSEPQWIPILLIEYTWAFDNLRHNR